MQNTMKPFKLTSDQAMEIFEHIRERVPNNFTYYRMENDHYEIKCNRTGDTIVLALWSLRDQSNAIVAFHKDFI